MKGKAAHKEKHEFALFVESLSSLIRGKDSGDRLVASDETLLHRMITVLRLEKDDHCILFDRSVHISAVILLLSGKKQVEFSIQSIKPTTILQPTITFLLPVLKRDDYESALYALTEVGVNTIQLVFTQKTVQQWSGGRDTERARRIMIAAAEQSKHFAFPDLKEPMSLEAALQTYDNATKIFFDPQGKKFFEVMQTLYTTQPQRVVLLIGPEGDLDREEKKIVRKHDFIFCALTPTIVRAVQAAALGAGFVRSLLSNNE